MAKYSVWITTFDRGGDKELDTYDCETWGEVLDTIKRYSHYLGSTEVKHPNGEFERIK